MKEITNFNLDVMKKDFDLSDFSNYQKELIDTFKGLMCTGAFSKKQIIATLNITPQIYNKLLNNPEVKAYMEQYSPEVKRLSENRMNLLTPKALDVLEDSLNSADEKLRVDVAKDLLNRTGLKAKEEKNVNINHSYEQTLNTANEFGFTEEDILNAEFEEV